MDISFGSSGESLIEKIEHVATIGGILFAALQLYFQRRQMQQGNYLAVMQARTDITQREIATPSLMAIYDLTLQFPRTTTLQEWNTLTEQQKILYFHLGTVLSQQERAIMLLSEWYASRDDLRAEQAALRELAALPIFRQVWPYMRHFYNSRLVRYIETL